MAESYIERKKRRDAIEEEKNHIIFGLMGGIILMLVGGLNWLSAGQGFGEIVCVCVTALGLLLVLLAIVVPALLRYPYKAFRFFGNTAGKAVFAILLTALYVLLILPVGLILRRKREAQGYFTWEQPPAPRSLFRTIDHTAAAKTGKASYFGIVYRLLSIFAANRKFILIPIVIILVIAGLILFFVSSNVMTAFIYTIF